MKYLILIVALLMMISCGDPGTARYKNITRVECESSRGLIIYKDITRATFNPTSGVIDIYQNNGKDHITVTGNCIIYYN